MQNYNSGAETDVLYLDFAKAFDKVDHNLLIAKLQIYGIQGKLLDWIRSFLRDRSQIVTVDGFHSVEKPVLSGIPQGSVLGPILFIIYVNDLHFHIQNCKSSAFADDTKIQRKITKVGDMEIVNVEIQNATDWSIKNNMLLNDLKFVYLRYEIKKITKWQHYPTIQTAQNTCYPQDEILNLHHSQGTLVYCCQQTTPGIFTSAR